MTPRSPSSAPIGLFTDAVLDRPDETGARRVLQVAERPPAPEFDELFFDASSGQLTLASPSGAARSGGDAVSAVQMARSGFFNDPVPPDNAALLRGMERIADGADDGEELFFDPSTGQLLLRPRGQAAPRPDQVSAVSMARTGFFAAARLAASPQRMAAEQAILKHYFSSFTISGTTALGTLRANSGTVYTVRLDLPGFPHCMPAAYIIAPQLVMADGKLLSSLVTSHEMHTIGNDINGFPRICHWHPDVWTPTHTLYQVLMKVRLWIEAWEGHTRTGRPLDTYVASVAI